MATDLGKLKEQKFPRYTKGTPWDEYFTKLKVACRTRGNATQVIYGTYMNDITEPDPVTGVYADADDTARAAENDRVFADLILAMPNDTLTKSLTAQKH